MWPSEGDHNDVGNRMWPSEGEHNDSHRLVDYMLSFVRHSVSPAATEKPVGAPRPSASIGAAGATVTPRSPLPGIASSREVLGPLARHSVRPGACAEARCLVAYGSKSANPTEAANAQPRILFCFKRAGRAATQYSVRGRSVAFPLTRMTDRWKSLSAELDRAARCPLLRSGPLCCPYLRSGPLTLLPSPAVRPANMCQATSSPLQWNGG